MYTCGPVYNHVWMWMFVYVHILCVHCVLMYFMIMHSAVRIRLVLNCAILFRFTIVKKTENTVYHQIICLSFVFLVVVAVFSLPKVYETYKVQIDNYINMATTQLNNILAQWVVLLFLDPFCLQPSMIYILACVRAGTLIFWDFFNHSLICFFFLLQR